LLTTTNLSALVASVKSKSHDLLGLDQLVASILVDTHDHLMLILETILQNGVSAGQTLIDLALI